MDYRARSFRAGVYKHEGKRVRLDLIKANQMQKLTPGQV